MMTLRALGPRSCCCARRPAVIASSMTGRALRKKTVRIFMGSPPRRSREQQRLSPSRARPGRRLEDARETIDLTRVMAGYGGGCVGVQYIIALLLMQFGDK